VEGILTVVALVACPVGMGLMMWFMSKGMRSGRSESGGASIDELRAEQRRIRAQLDRLEDSGEPSDDRSALR
jgi:hypothetical protein